MIKRHERICIGLTIFLSLIAACAMAQPSAGGAAVTLSPAAYSNPGSAAAEINVFLTAHVAALINDADAAGQTKSREALLAATKISNPPGPAPAPFLLEYARVLNRIELPLINSKTSLRGRLNIAIVTAKVAADAGNSALAQAAEALIKDPAQPVVLWGLKAAQPMVPQVVQIKIPGQAVHPMIAAIVPATLKHPAGIIFEEAYQALGAAQGEAAVIDELIKLWSNRLNQYKQTLPEDPAVDGKPVFFVTTSQTWKAVFKTKEQRVKIMQMVVDQMSLAAQQADAGAQGEKHDQLLRLVAQCGSACWAVGTHQNIAKLVDASLPVTKINPGAIARNVKLLPYVEPIVAEVKSAFAGVNAPPTIGPAPAAGVAKP